MLMCVCLFKIDGGDCRNESCIATSLFDEANGMSIGAKLWRTETMYMCVICDQCSPWNPTYMRLRSNVACRAQFRGWWIFTVDWQYLNNLTLKSAPIVSAYTVYKSYPIPLGSIAFQYNGFSIYFFTLLYHKILVLWWTLFNIFI